MRDPHRRRALAIALFLIGVGGLAATTVVPGVWSGPTWPGLLAGFGIAGGVLGLIGVSWTHEMAKGQARLLRGQGVIVAWQVDAARWRVFMARDAAGAYPGPRNRLALPPEPPPEGMRVIVGETALQVGRDYHHDAFQGLRGVRLLPGPPPCLMFDFVVMDDSGHKSEAAARIPVAHGGDAEARKVLRHHQAKPGAAVAQRGGAGSSQVS